MTAPLSTLPPPPVPDDLNLRDVAEMPLDVRRLRDSALVATASPEAFRAAVLLWAACWHQIPAGSLPATDIELAGLAGYGRDLVGWAAVKADAMRGFVPRSDGRLYHLVICEYAEAAEIAERRRRKLSRQQSVKGKKSAKARRALGGKAAKTAPAYDPQPVGAIEYTHVDEKGRVSSGLVEPVGNTDENSESVNNEGRPKNQEDTDGKEPRLNHGCASLRNHGSPPPASPSPPSSPFPLINPLTSPPSTPPSPSTPQNPGAGIFDSIAVPAADADGNTDLLGALGIQGKVRIQRARGAEPPACPVLEIVAAYHEILPMCPSQRVLGQHARSALQARWREDRKRQTLAWWRGYFEHVRDDCPFLVGGTHHGFRADLAWLVGPKNFAKVCNGNYERQGEA